MQIDFSVVIPTYNQAEFLKKALDSVFLQTCKNYEIIIIDNYSTDNTQEVVNSYDSKKILYRKIKNHGIIAISRNEGIKHSKGDWIAFLDSDDSWYKNRLEIIHEFLKKYENDYEVLCTDELIIENIRNKKEIWRYGPFKKKFYKYLLEVGNCVSTSASVVKKEFLKKNNINFNENKNFITVEDYDFFMTLAKTNARFKFLNEVLGEHSFHLKSYSANYNFHQKALLALLKYHVFNVQQFSENKTKLWNKLQVSLHFKDLIYLFKYKKEYLKSFIYFLKIFFLSPFNSTLFIFLRIKKKIEKKL